MTIGIGRQMMAISMTRGLTLASAILIASGLAGCAGAVAEVPGEDSYAGNSETTTAVIASDPDPVTREDYEAAFKAFSECMSEAGGPINIVTTTGGIYQYTFPAEKDAAYAACYRDFLPIDRDWQIANEYNSYTQVALRECLIDAGGAPGKTVDEVWVQLKEFKVDIDACLEAAAAAKE